jgi:hypothetical protein
MVHQGRDFYFAIYLMLCFLDYADKGFYLSNVEFVIVMLLPERFIIFDNTHFFVDLLSIVYILIL